MPACSAVASVGSDKHALVTAPWLQSRNAPTQGWFSSFCSACSCHEHFFVVCGFVVFKCKGFETNAIGTVLQAERCGQPS